MLVPLSLSRGKLDYYLLPLYPAVSLLVGRYLAATAWGRFDRVWARVVLLAQAAALAFVLARPPQVPPEWLPGGIGRGALVAVMAAGASRSSRRPGVRPLGACSRLPPRSSPWPG